jgi:diguanylate cyclase (GGDEF)-like protein
MKMEELRTDYTKLLHNYLEAKEESLLYEANKLSRRLVNAKIGPEELLALHIEVVQEVAQNLKRDEKELFPPSFDLLLEAMSSYGLAYRESLRVKEREHNQLKLYIKKIEQINKELDKRIAKLATLQEIGQLITSTLDLERVLNLLVEQIQRIIDYHTCCIMLLNEQTQELVTKVMRAFDNGPIRNLRFKIGEGVAGWVLKYRRPLNIPDVRKDTRYIYPLERIKSILSVPLIYKEKPYGVFNINSMRPNAFTEEDQKVLSILGTYAAQAIENAKLYEEVKKLSITDGLTRLYNYRHFLEHLESEIQRAQRYNLSFSLIMMDLDEFKRVNDTHGHLVGNEVLKKISKILMENIRRSSFVARYGGEEFCLILVETGKEEAKEVGERIRKLVEKEGEQLFYVTVSMGISCYPEDATSSTELIQLADKALYIAKREGGNRVHTLP